MNEEFNRKNTVSDKNVFPAPVILGKVNTNRFYFYSIIITVIVVVVIGGLYFYSYSSKINEQSITLEHKQKLNRVPDDLVFLRGFWNTRQEWPINQRVRFSGYQESPLTRLRQAYCERVGYEYADFGGDCFVYQYYNSYKTYYDNSAEFTVFYPSLWQIDLQPLNYGFIIDPKVSLRRQGASCALVYGLVDENKLLSASNISTSTVSFGYQASGNVASETKRLSKIILSFDRELSNEEKAAGYTNSKIVAIPHFPYSSSPFGFLITSGDKQPLVEACAEEFDGILGGRSIYYPSARLSNQSNGILSIQDVSSWFEREADIPQKNMLLFDNFSTGKEESIVSATFSNIQRISDPFLSGGKIFYTDGSATNTIIKTVDILNGENMIVPLSYDATKPIHSFFIRGDILYYLSGTFCKEYRNKCKDMNLFSYNIKSGISENLAGGIIARDIDGFSATGDSLILSWSDGDAGCAWGSYQSFTLTTKVVKDLGSYSYCEGDTEGTYTKFKKLVADSDSFSYLVVKSGKIFSPSGTDTYSGRIYIRVNTTEYPKDR